MRLEVVCLDDEKGREKKKRLIDVRYIIVGGRDKKKLRHTKYKNSSGGFRNCSMMILIRYPQVHRELLDPIDNL